MREPDVRNARRVIEDVYLLRLLLAGVPTLLLGVLLVCIIAFGVLNAAAVPFIAHRWYLAVLPGTVLASLTWSVIVLRRRRLPSRMSAQQRHCAALDDLRIMAERRPRWRDRVTCPRWWSWQLATVAQAVAIGINTRAGALTQAVAVAGFLLLNLAATFGALEMTHRLSRVLLFRDPRPTRHTPEI